MFQIIDETTKAIELKDLEDGKIRIVERDVFFKLWKLGLTLTIYKENIIKASAKAKLLGKKEFMVDDDMVSGLEDGKVILKCCNKFKNKVFHIPVALEMYMDKYKRQPVNI